MNSFSGILVDDDKYSFGAFDKCFPSTYDTRQDVSKHLDNN